MVSSMQGTFRLMAHLSMVMARMIRTEECMRDSQLNVGDKQAHGSPLYGDGQDDKDRGVHERQSAQCKGQVGSWLTSLW